MQAALGLSQIGKLEHFVARRKENFAYLKGGLKPLEEFLILPEATEHADPSWFGFPIGVKPGAPFTRDQLTGLGSPEDWDAAAVRRESAAPARV